MDDYVDRSVSEQRVVELPYLGDAKIRAKTW